jgi:predicted nucleic acid-binding Zn ribbon protein
MRPPGGTIFPEARAGRKSMLTLDQAASISGLSKSALRRAVCAGKLSATRAIEDGYSYRIDPVELQRFMSKRVCLVCGAALTGAYQRNLCSDKCRVARVKEQKDERLLDPEYHEQFYAKRRLLKSKPSYKAKARIAARKLRSDPDVREKRNAPRRKHPVQYDAHVGAYHQAHPELASHKQWTALKGDPVALAEHNRRRVEKRVAKKQTRPKWKGGSINEAMDFLRRKLAKGPQPAKEIEPAAEAKGISTSTLKRARKELGVKAEKARAIKGAWMWRI